MDVVVADTSVLINLRRGRLLEQCFALPSSFKMPDLIYKSALAGREAGSEFAKSLLRLGLEVVELNGEEVGRGILHWQQHPSLTLPDSFALALAASRRWTLLSDDPMLKTLAQGLKAACHGVLWVIDQSHREGIASARGLVSSLTAIRDHPRCSLPTEELSRLIRHYS